MNQLAPAEILDISTYLDAPDVLAAGKLCLEFANTVNWHASETPEESLNSYHDLVAWAVTTGVYDEAAGRELMEQAAKQPRLANQVYAWATELREAIYRTFAAVAAKERPAASDIALINEALPFAFALPEIVAESGEFGVRWRGDDKGLDGILWPIIRSAVRVLTTDEHSRIGQCADDRGCGYLFYDTSRNRSRRWCDMGSCGNRAKSQRHYARHRHT